MHDNFLKYLVDTYYAGDSELYDKYVQLSNTAVDGTEGWTWQLTGANNDTASEIANNWAMTSAAWYWTGPVLQGYNEDKGAFAPERKKDLNLYSQGDNGSGTNYPESEGLFIIVQYYVNGWTKPKNSDGATRNADYAQVASGGEYDLIYDENGTIITHVKINGQLYPAPDRLFERLNAYRDITQKW